MMAKIEWYEEILALEPGSKVFFPFAKRLAEDGLHDKALAVLRHGLVQHPEYLEARVFLTHLLFAVGDTQTAMTESQQVFARLAPYPAFWEALSLANEAMPGDMSLLLRFMAESLRNPGLSMATAMRRGLNAPAPVAQPVDSAELAEPEPLVEPEPIAENADPAPPHAVALEVDESEPLEVEEATEAEESEDFAEIADATLADPLDPVVDELCETGEAQPCDEQSLPLFGEEPALPISVVNELPEEAPTAATFPENAEAMLACAASVDEALAELNEDMDGDLEGEEPPLLTAEDLDELDKTLFSEAAEVPSAEEASKKVDSLGEIEHVEELAELDVPAALPEDMPAMSENLEVQPEDMEVNPFLAAVVDADDTVPAMEPAYELHELTDESADTEPSADVAEIADVDEVSEAEEIQETGDSSEPEEAPGLYLDGGLLDMTDDADETPVLLEEPEESEEASVLNEEPEISVQEEYPAQGVASSVHVDIQSQNFTHETPDLHVEIQPTQDESDDLDMPDDGPVRTRSMADVLAEQGDIDGALTIYDELLHKATPDESALLAERMDALRSQKTVEKTEQKPVARADKAGLRSMLENLAGRLEKRAKA